MHFSAIEIVFGAVFGTTVALGKVCSPNECIKGFSNSPMMAFDRPSKTYLAPGTYVPDSPLSAEEIRYINPDSDANVTSMHFGLSLVVAPPLHPLLFSKDKYGGQVVEDLTGWKSAYLPEGFYGLIEPGKALWGSIPDQKQLSGGSAKLREVGLSKCDPPCASGGACVLDSGKPVCRCKEGWTGSSCDRCATGFFGKDCAACTQDCSICDDGLGGTGKCLGTATTPLKVCNCAHGTCDESGDCTCAAGYATNATSNGSKCSECAVGFYKDSQDNCLACPLGCSTCSLRDGTADEATCTACIASLTLSSASPATCVPRGTCTSGQYFDTSAGSCRTCSPACSSCTGPSTSECLACASPRVNLDGECVGFDPSTGVCDSSLSGLQSVYVVNNEKRRCDSCPAGCASCTLPSFSSGTTYTSATCRTCQDGYLLESDRCVKTCSEGWFLPEGSVTNGTCQRCDSSCTDCVASATTCTKCPAPSFASGGVCISTCPSNTSPTNGTCVPCSPDCSTCSSSNTCITCSADRPILLNGRCVDYCPRDQYFDGTTCSKCDSSCGSCLGPSSTECTSCSPGLMLKSGKCAEAECKHGTVPGLNLCLEDLLVNTGDMRYLGFLAFIIVFAIIGLGVWWYVRRQRRQTREATKDFAEAMDEREVGDRMMILRLEKVLGLDRVRPQSDAPRLAEEGQQKAKERKRLRELLLVARRKRERGGVATNDKGKGRSAEEIPLEDRTAASMNPNTTSAFASANTPNEKKVGWADQRDSHWFAPPPPYAYASNEASASSSSIATSALYSYTDTLPPLQTKIVSMSSPTSPDFAPRALRPPPRRTETSSSFGSSSNVNVNVKVPVGQGEADGKELDRRRSLKKVWPAMPSPVFGQGGEDIETRKAEGWI